MDWFVNYWREPCRTSSVNLAVARVFVCLLAAWKVAAYPFSGVSTFPAYLLEVGAPGVWGLWPQYGRWIGWEQAIGVVCLIACACGVARRLTALTAAAIISHLTAVVWPVTAEKTWLPTVYFLILYAVFCHEEGHVSWPAAKVIPTTGPDGSATAPEGEIRPNQCLKWFLVTIALIYFFAGVHKFRGGEWTTSWASPLNISRMLEERAFCRGNELPAAASWLQQSPALLGAIGASTIVLELGLLVAVLTDRLLTPCFLGLAAMHLGIWATMRVNYFTDFGAMYLVFLPWDTVLEGIVRSRADRRARRCQS